MKTIKICNKCHEIFNDDALEQNDMCPECEEGDVIFINEEQYLKQNTEEKKKIFLNSLVLCGTPDSLRYFTVHASFSTKSSAEIFTQEILKKGICPNASVQEHDGEWGVNGFTTATLREYSQLVKAVQKIIKKHKTQVLKYWTDISFR